jgi:hypothetical protein
VRVLGSLKCPKDAQAVAAPQKMKVMANFHQPSLLLLI